MLIVGYVYAAITLRCVRERRSQTHFFLSPFPESSSEMAAPPASDGPGQPQQAFFMSQYKTAAMSWFDLPFYWRCSSSTLLYRCLAGQTADPVSLAEEVNSAVGWESVMPDSSAWCSAFSSRAAVSKLWHQYSKCVPEFLCHLTTV